MMDNKYAKAYSEVLEILKYIPVEDYNKIPKTKIELFRTNADSDYIFNYDPNRTLKEQNVSDITAGIIILLFRDFWATEVQRTKIIEKQKYDRMIIEEEKMVKYNPNNIFKNTDSASSIDTIEKKQELSLIETNNIEWYKKFWRFFKNLLKK